MEFGANFLEDSVSECNPFLTIFSKRCSGGLGYGWGTGLLTNSPAARFSDQLSLENLFTSSLLEDVW